MTNCETYSGADLECANTFARCGAALAAYCGKPRVLFAVVAAGYDASVDGRKSSEPSGARYLTEPQAELGRVVN